MEPQARRGKEGDDASARRWTLPGDPRSRAPPDPKHTRQVVDLLAHKHPPRPPARLTGPAPAREDSRGVDQKRSLRVTPAEQVLDVADPAPPGKHLNIA